ncbi:MAG: trypsin-like peptidase domain-containing protein [Bacteroidota bacterium]
MRSVLVNAGFALVISFLSIFIYHQAFVKGVPTYSTESELQTTQVSMPTYTAGQAGSLPADFRGAANTTMPAVVHIKSYRTYTRRRSSIYEEFFGIGRSESNDRNKISTGSGVIISSDGYIVTNNHVIESADELEVTLFNNKTYKATVIGTDPTTDLGLIQIQDRDLPVLELANSDNASVGEWVLAVGNPFNIGPTATAGIVSAIGRDLDIIKNELSIESFIQTDAAVNPGNSGGALVNTDGNLLGINTAIASPTGTYAGYAFAVPANIVRKVVEDLRVYGAVQRGYIGISRVINLNSEVADKLDISLTEGVYVESMATRSAASEAGIREGDVITRVDNIPVKSDARLKELIGRNRPGDVVKITVNRRGAYRDYEVKLTNESGKTRIEANKRSELLNSLGMELENLSSRFLSDYGVENGVRVSKLYAGKIRSKTDMKEGFVILNIDGQEVYNTEEVVQQLERKKGSVKLEGFYPGRRYLYNYSIEL